MKFRAIGAAIALLAVADPRIVHADTCQALSNTSNTYFTSLSLLMNLSTSDLDQLPIDDMVNPIETGFPSLATCIASLDIGYIVNIVNSWHQGLPDILHDINSTDFSGILTQSMVIFDICPLYSGSVRSFVFYMFMPFLMNQMGPCCSQFQADVVTVFGKNVTTVVEELAQLAGTMLCDVKMTVFDGTYVMGSCGYQLLSHFINDSDYMDALFTILQVPNDQVCLAVQNEPFNTTMNTTLSLGDPGMGYGICYKAMDAFFSAIAAYPWVATVNFTSPDSGEVVPLSNLFVDGSCIAGNDLMSWVLSNDSLVLQALQTLDLFIAAFGLDDDTSNNSSGSSVNISTVFIDALSPYASSFISTCFRMPNNVTSCDFSDEKYAPSLPYWSYWGFGGSSSSMSGNHDPS